MLLSSSPINNMNISALIRPYKPLFMTEEEIMTALKLMEQDDLLKTDPTLEGPSNQPVAFINKHATYLRGHSKVNPEFYLANLRTMIKIRPSK